MSAPDQKENGMTITDDEITEAPVRNDVADAVAGLRALADFMEGNRSLFDGLYIQQEFIVSLCYLDGGDDETLGKFGQFARSAGTWEKSGTDKFFHLERRFSDQIKFSVFAQRDVVCEKKVIGVETVEIADPNAPKVTVEREVVEWECKPLLSA